MAAPAPAAATMFAPTLSLPSIMKRPNDPKEFGKKKTKFTKSLDNNTLPALHKQNIKHKKICVLLMMRTNHLTEVHPLASHKQRSKPVHVPEYLDYKERHSRSVGERWESTEKRKGQQRRKEALTAQLGRRAMMVGERPRYIPLTPSFLTISCRLVMITLPDISTDAAC